MDTDLIDELKGTLNDLGEAVEGLKAQAVDQETVERVVQEVLAKQAEANPALARRSGYQPGDEDNSDIPEREIAGVVGQALRDPAQRFDLIQMGRVDRGDKKTPVTLSTQRVAEMLRVEQATVEEFREAATNVALLQAFCQSYNGSHPYGLGKDVRETSFFQDEFMPLVQAMDTATAAEGTEYVPRELSASLIDRVNLELRVVPLFPIAEMPTPTWDIPGRAVSRTRGGKAVEQTADTGQTKFKVITPGTRKVTLTAVKFAVESLTSKELEEDSIIAILPFIQDELVDYLAADWEDATLNGDATGAHMDSDVTDADDPRKNWEGLRSHAQAAGKTDLVNAVPTVLNTIRASRKKMGKYGVRPGQLAHIVSTNSLINLLGDANVLTLDKYGPQATILSGELASVDGSPIIVSEYVRNDLNATGVHDGVTVNRTTILSVYRRGFLFGNRRSLTVQVLRELYAESDQDAVIATHRKAFQTLYPTSEITIGQAYNVAT